MAQAADPQEWSFRQSVFLAWVAVLQFGMPVHAVAIGERLSARTEPGPHAVTVADSIRMTKLGAYSERAQFSPDGTQFVIVVKRGDVENNTNEYSILLWRSADIFSSPLPTPRVLVRMVSSSDRPAIGSISWLKDGKRIAFLGENPAELQQVYVYELQTGHLRRVTNHPTNVRFYSVASDAKTIAFSAEAPHRNLFGNGALRFGVVVTNQKLVDLVRGRAEEPDYDRDQLFFQAGAKSPRQLSSESFELSSSPSLSPDGRTIAIAVHVAQVPDRWREYADPGLCNAMDLTQKEGNFQGLSTYILMDTTTGASRPLLGSPLNISRISEAAWSPDSRTLVLTNMFLPLDGTQSTERETRKFQSFTVEVDVSTGGLAKISNDSLYGVEWGPKGKRLTAHIIQQQSSTFYGIGPLVRFEKNTLKWERTQSVEPEQFPPAVVVEQDWQTPPRIVATDATGRRVTLWELNPVLNQLRLGRVEEIQWNSTDGHLVKGGLYYPVDYVSVHRYPLVIQTHGWNPHQFWIDGPFTTAFAAQELVGHNVMVLQADMNVDDLDSPREAPREMAAYEGAIDYLDKRGMIDRDRVGIVGYSRSCFHVKYALTHSKYKFAAASITDGVDAGYFQYILSIPSNPRIRHEFDDVYGGPPFGESAQSWLRGSPGFNADKVQTPTRITALGAASVLFEWEWLSALRRLHKAVEFVVIQDGSHILEKPQDRIISQQGNVDWFCFWLKGEEDPDPTKAEQYRRWRDLQREMTNHR